MQPSSAGNWRTVFQKEFLEVFRDQRTIFNIVISPLLITPLLFALIGVVVKGQIKQAEAEKIAVAMVGGASAPSILENMKGAPNIEFKPMTRAEAEQGIRARELRAAVILPEDAEQRMTDNKTVTVKLLVDQGSQVSVEAKNRLEKLFIERGQLVVAERLINLGLSSELAAPYRTQEEGISGGGSTATLALASFLPYILALSAIMGGLYAANDSVAGEKERGTLETLLVSPLSRRDLVVGKFVTVASVSLVSSLLSVVGLLWPFFVPLKAFEWLARGGLTLTPLGIAAILLVQIPLAVIGAGLLLAISTFARNQKEAQTYLSPVIIIASVAAMMSLLLKPDSSIFYSLVPILNAALILKGALQGTLNFGFAALASLTSFIYAAVAVGFAIALFEREEVLLKA